MKSGVPRPKNWTIQDGSSKVLKFNIFHLFGTLKFNETAKNEFLGMETKHSLPENRVQNSWKGQIPQFLPPQAAILDSFIFRRGHPGFRTFVNFFFENGIRRY